MAGPGLPTNITAGATGHIGHTNTVHGIVNKFSTTSPTTAGWVPSWNTTTGTYEPAAQTGGGATALVLNVMDYGAQGNGTTNDSTSVQSAIDAANTAGGGVVWFPKGTYKCNVNLKSGVTLAGGAGMYGYLPGGANGSAILKANASGYVVTLPDGTTGAAVVGLNISGNGLAGGIKTINCSWCRFAQIGFDACPDQAIAMTNPSGFSVANVVEDILATNCVTNHTRSAQIGVVEIDGTDCFVNRVEASASIGTYVVTSSSLWVCALYIKGANHFISNVVAEFADIGIVATDSVSRYSDIRADHNGGHGILVSGSTGTWTNVFSYSNGRGTAATYDALQVNNGGHRFTNVYIDVQGSETYRYGINDTTNTGAGLQARNTYVNTLIKGASTGDATAVNATDFLGPAFLNPALVYRTTASETTVNVFGYGIISMQHTSAVTVTDFTNGVPGQRITVIGNSNSTIQNNSRIINNTGANITTVTGRAYDYVLYANAWHGVA